MIDIRLDDLELYQLLRKKQDHEHVASVLQGLLIVMSGDAREFLEFVRNRFPAFTSHNLQHSWRIVKRVENILSPEAKANLSSLEIFSFIVAAAFHDVGMISQDGTADEVRRTHHSRSNDFLQEYMANRLTIISEYAPRLAKCIGFIMRAHGMAWEDVTASELFKRPEKILEQPLRANVLAILLRIGDLLDLDSERSCDALQRHASAYFDDPTSQVHHNRHKHVVHFNYDRNEIAITVEANSKEEHSIWSEWLSYLRQDILHANTFVFRDSLSCYRLPVPVLDARKAPGASYETWPLRFELDDKGRIWEVISQSIYVGRFDFVRELVQNAIDATLTWMYLRDEASVEGEIPRLWSLPGYHPIVLVLFDARKGTIEVVDNGVGMDKEALQGFLFRVAETGFGERPAHRSKKFPSIAKFGIGFISCLVRANAIVISTRKRKSPSVTGDVGRRILLKTQALDAYSEEQQCPEGTSIWLDLKTKFTAPEVSKYVLETFVYPSAPIIFLDLAGIAEMYEFGKQLGAEVEPWSDLERAAKRDSVYEFANTAFERCNADFKTIRHDAEQRDRATELQAESYRNRFFLIRPTGIFPDLVLEPYFISLNNDLDFTDFSRSLQRGKRDGRSLRLVWIPVRIFIPDRGIDWASLHGFILREDRVHRSVMIYQGLADEFQNDEHVVTMGEDKWDAGDFSELEERTVDLFDMMSERHRDLQDRPENAGVASLDLSNIRVVSDGVLFPNAAGEMVTPFGRGGDYTERLPRRMKTESEAMVVDLGRSITALDNMIFQDGLPVPVQGWSIAPIGACRSQCNLTGSARFELNVSRNAINESPALLSVWAEEVGAEIQWGVLNIITETFRKNACQYREEELFTPLEREDPNNLFQYTSKVLLNSVLPSIRSR